MLYRFLKFLMNSSLSAHYLNIKGIGLKNIPKSGPLLIAASHPNSFLDAIIVACVINRPLYFLARSDVFKAKWANYILRKLNLVPIYRIQEGHQNLNKNNQTFKECFNILEEGGAILIFVEGVSLTDFKLRPLKKGLARIAFGFAELHNFSKNCAIVPLALNYDRPTKFRSKINIGIGQIQYINDYQEAYETNKNSAYELLNQIIYKELEDHTIEVKDENLGVYYALSELDNCFEQNSLNRKILIAQHIEEVEKHNPESLKKMKRLIGNVYTILSDHRLNFRKLKINAGLKTKNILLLIAASPFAIICFILNFIPLYIAKIIADKKVKLDEFYVSVRCVTGSILWIIYTLILTILIMKIHFLGILTPFALYWMARFYLSFYEKLKYVSSTIRLTKLRREKDVFSELQQDIKKIYRIRTKDGFAPNH